MKRTIIITAALLCVTLCVPLAVFSQSQDFVMNGTVLVRYNGNAANVIIPEGVTSIEESAFLGNRSLKSVTIPSSVTSIGYEAFIMCDNLRTVTVSRMTRTYGIVFPATAQIIYSD